MLRLLNASARRRGTTGSIITSKGKPKQFLAQDADRGKPFCRSGCLARCRGWREAKSLLTVFHEGGENDVNRGVAVPTPFSVTTLELLDAAICQRYMRLSRDAILGCSKLRIGQLANTKTSSSYWLHWWKSFAASTRWFLHFKCIRRRSLPFKLASARDDDNTV